VVDLEEPFQLEEVDALGFDRRIGALKRLLDTFRSDDAGYYVLYREVNRLWQGVEARSTFAVR
jgi:hypothetical protein